MLKDSIYLGSLHQPQLETRMQFETNWRINIRTERSIIILASILVIAILIGLSTLNRPRLIPAIDSFTEFSAERAMGHVSEISKKSHLPGSAEIIRVGSYIIGELFPIKRRNGFPVMRGEASSADLVPPQVTILKDETGAGTRILELGVMSPRGASVIMLDVEPGDSVKAVTLAGKRIAYSNLKSGLWSLTYYAVPDDGFEFTLEISPSQPVNIQLIDQT